MTAVSALATFLGRTALFYNSLCMGFLLLLLLACCIALQGSSSAGEGSAELAEWVCMLAACCWHVQGSNTASR
jgi:hypothetical protein